METTRPARPLLIFFFFRLIALLGIIPFLINTLDILLHISAPALGRSYDPVSRGLLGLLVAPLTLVIAILCVRRVPGNLIGWLLFSFAYGISIEVIRADLLPKQLGVFLGNFIIIQFWIAFLITPLYFPNGQLHPARANRWGNPLITIIILLTSVISTFSAATYSWGTVEVPNPLLLFHWNYTNVTIPMIVFLIGIGILVVILRYRSSRDLERFQLRWFLFGVLFQGLLTVITLWAPAPLDWVSNRLTSLYGLIIPITVGIAVLRYRLYDIDLIIRRTLQYGLVSLLLGLVYYGLVLLLGQVFLTVSGQTAPLAIVISTLVIATLFNPLRNQIQAAIDRRFFRRKYNAERAVAAFAAAASREVEFAPLTGQLVDLVEQTVQPARVWLWLRAQNGRKETPIDSFVLTKERE